jgi:hypothetical protein
MLLFEPLHRCATDVGLHCGPFGERIPTTPCCSLWIRQRWSRWSRMMQHRRRIYRLRGKSTTTTSGSLLRTPTCKSDAFGVTAHCGTAMGTGQSSPQMDSSTVVNSAPVSAVGAMDFVGHETAATARLARHSKAVQGVSLAKAPRSTFPEHLHIAFPPS